ncbi:MAG TPA: heparinase II/III family protein [Roseiflexaceae bacterium]|nr:heparinase II/III family protein [Roseiflexaceae bacterium]
MTHSPMPSFRAIREAILAAPPRPAGFPLEALRDPAGRQALRAAAHLQQLLSDLRAEAERARTTPLAPLSFDLFRRFEASGDRAGFEQVYFDRRRRLLGLALTAALDETDRPLPALADLIWELCGEYSWALPAHLPVGVAAARAHRLPPEQVVDLFAAHTAHALAEVLALLGERLDPWLHQRVRSEVERRIFQPLFHDPRHFTWEWEPINWAAVCGGCAGMAALVLEDDRERLAGMIDRVIRALECFLEGFGDDGGCAEGIGYWVYGFGFYTYFAEMLGRFTEGRLDLMRGEKQRRIAAFPQAVCLGGEAAVNFSDADGRIRIHPGLGAHLAARYGQPVPGLGEPTLDHDHVFRWGHVTRDLLWTDPAALHAPIGDGSAYLPDLGWVVERRVIDGAVLAFSAKGGHNGEPHNHNDLGHFILQSGGESLLADLGAGRYTRQYFGAQRYEALHTGSHGHSVPLVNGQPQSAGRDYAASVLAYEPQRDGLRFALDLTRAYADPALRSLVRVFDWSVERAARRATLRLTDTFGFTEPPSSLEERFVSLHAPSLENGTATWSGARGAITMRFDRRRFEPGVEAVATEGHRGEPLTVYLLRLRALEAPAKIEAAFEFAVSLR